MKSISRISLLFAALALGFASLTASAEPIIQKTLKVTWLKTSQSVVACQKSGGKTLALAGEAACFVKTNDGCTIASTENVYESLLGDALASCTGEKVAEQSTSEFRTELVKSYDIMTTEVTWQQTDDAPALCLKKMSFAQKANFMNTRTWPMGCTDNGTPGHPVITAGVGTYGRILGEEFLHAFGMNHPEDIAVANVKRTWMWWGYTPTVSASK